jgi:hypothetical protein
VYRKKGDHENASKSLSPGHPHLKDLQDDFEMICEDL